LRLYRKGRHRDLRFHHLRHTAASWLHMKGAKSHTVAQLLGNKDLRMAVRYQHLSLGFVADAVGRLDNAFAEFRQFVTARKELQEGVTAND
jgi:site-specific recombinase XerD